MRHAQVPRLVARAVSPDGDPHAAVNPEILLQFDPIAAARGHLHHVAGDDEFEPVERTEVRIEARLSRDADAAAPVDAELFADVVIVDLQRHERAVADDDPPLAKRVNQASTLNGPSTLT